MQRSFIMSSSSYQPRDVQHWTIRHPSIARIIPVGSCGFYQVHLVEGLLTVCLPVRGHYSRTIQTRLSSCVSRPLPLKFCNLRAMSVTLVILRTSSFLVLPRRVSLNIALSIALWVTLSLLIRLIVSGHVLEPYVHHWQHKLVSLYDSSCSCDHREIAHITI